MDYFNSFRGKKLLILGGAGVHCKVVEAAKEMGVYTIVTDYLVDSPAKKIADESLMISILDVDAIVKYCEDNAIDGVINFCNDPAQKAHQEICERLGFNNYGNAEQVLSLANKRVFKEKCLQAGVDVIQEYTIEDVESGVVEYPVVAKPVDSRGSRGVTICYNREDLLRALPKVKQESSNGDFIIEKYLGNNKGFSAAYVVINGAPYLTRTLDRYEGRAEDNLQRQCICARHPSKYSETYLQTIHSRVCKLIENLGLKNAPIFMQGFIDGDTVRFYDAGLRFAGSEYERILKNSTGVDIVKAFVGYSLGGSLHCISDMLSAPYLLNGNCGLQVFVDAYPGCISRINGIDRLSKCPAVINIQQKQYVGDIIPDTGDVKQRVFEVVILTRDNACAIEQVVNVIRDSIEIIDGEGKNITAPIVDASLLF